MVAQHHVRQAFPRGRDVLCQLGVVAGPTRSEPGRVGLVGEPSTDDLGPLGRVAGGRHLDGQAEAVEQL
ncbi:MAG: hypothetical protein JWM22_3340, partial [Frankiales bacterium]|nr:hypothetical protein [Frankiales bacterium]